MRIILTGAGGNLGQAAKRVFSYKNIELICFNDEQELDIANRGQVIKKLGHLDADYLLHTAAFTNVDGAEKDPELAFAVNALGSQNIALACEKNGAIPIYISTDYVFDGQKNEPYNEYDETSPLNVYGRSKLAGENCFKTLLNKYFIIRTSWLFGAAGKNFARWVFDRCQKGEELKIVTDQEGCPTFTDDLAGGILEIINTQAYGVYHFTNSGATTWYEWARYIQKLSGGNGAIKPTTWAELGLPAPRPAYSVLDNLNCRLNKLPQVRSWETATAYLINELNLSRADL